MIRIDLVSLTKLEEYTLHTSIDWFIHVLIVTTREEVDEFLRTKQKSLRGNSKSRHEDLGEAAQITMHEESAVEDEDDVQFGTLASKELEQFYRQENLDDGKLYVCVIQTALIN